MLGRVRQTEDVVRLVIHHEIPRLTLVRLAGEAVEEADAVQSLHRRAVTVAEEKVRMKPAAEVERFGTRVLRRQLEIKLHRDDDLVLEVELVRPELQRLVIGPEPERDLGHLLGILRPAHLENHLARETMLRQHLREAVAELRPADRNAAVKGIAAVVVALRRTENDRRMARRTVRKDVRPKERHLRRTVLVRQHHFGISGKALVKHNASRRPVPRIQLIDSHLNRPFLVTCEKSKADA